MKLRWLIPLLFVLPAFASGGTCPSASTYGPTGNQTLSALGITSCFYIAANGSDSNDGLSEASGHPWAHAPGMPNCTSSCNTVNSLCAANNCAGYGFIFRGDDAWHFGASTTPSTGGTLGASGGTGGTGTHPIYFGVDQSWYSGGSWARPQWTGDNALCGPGTVGGACSTAAYGTYSFSQYQVTSCNYQVGGSSNNLINMSGSSNFIFDNLELLGLCQSDGQLNGTDQFISYGSSSGMNFWNLYIHGWSHVHYVDVNGGGACGVCTNMRVFSGGAEPTTPDDTLRNVVIDGADSDPITVLACYCDWWDVAYSYIGYTGGAIVRYPHLFHDNLYEWWYENGHGNVFESVGDPSGSNAYYNDVFRHINTTNDPGDPLFWPYPPTGSTDYFFNTLVYDVGPMEYFNAGQNNSDEGTLTVFNNTWQANGTNQSGFSCSATGNHSTLNIANDHFVNSSGGYLASNCSSSTVTQTTNLLMTNATATTDGYTSSQTYAYSPTSGSSPTVGQGTNETSGYIAALTTAGLTAAATAAGSDITYACSYAGSGATPVCPDRIVNARPSSGAWDIGAYEYASSSQVVAPPTNLIIAQQAPKVELEWEASQTPGVDYDIWRSVDNGAFAVVKKGLKQLSWTDIDVVRGTTYAYKSKAYLPPPCSKNCDSIFSDEVSLTCCP